MCWKEFSTILTEASFQGSYGWSDTEIVVHWCWSFCVTQTFMRPFHDCVISMLSHLRSIDTFHQTCPLQYICSIRNGFSYDFTADSFPISLTPGLLDALFGSLGWVMGAIARTCSFLWSHLFGLGREKESVICFTCGRRSVFTASGLLFFFRKISCKFVTILMYVDWFVNYNRVCASVSAYATKINSASDRSHWLLFFLFFFWVFFLYRNHTVDAIFGFFTNQFILLYKLILQFSYL